LKRIFTKISFIILITIVFFACNSTKRVANKKLLLTKTEIVVDGKIISNEDITGYLTQTPNSKLLNIPFSLYFYNWAKQNPDSSFKAKYSNNPKKFNNLSKLLSSKQVYRLGESFWYKGIHNFLKTSGEEPVVIDESKTIKSLNKLKSHYFNQGYFNVEGNSKIDSIGRKKGEVSYNLKLNNPYFINDIISKISSSVMDSMYNLTKDASFVKKGQQYKSSNFEEERNRLTTYFRNNGVYNFQQNYVNYEIDTIDTKNKANINLVITDFNYREGDSTFTKPFEVYKISEVNIYTDTPSSRNKVKIEDSITYNNFNLYSKDKLKFKPKAITDAVFINKGGVYSDLKNNLTSRSLSNLKVFNFPTIQYIKDESIGDNSLIANIYLTPTNKYSFGYSFDLTHSNIQEFGIAGNTSLTIRNIFRGAETLEFALRGNIGSSSYSSNPNNTFFNLSEYGSDVKFNFPRIFFPFKTERIISKTMIPSTQISLGYFKQQNIGLDKENLSAILTYNWTPKRLQAIRFDLLNVQYIKNINTSNYFNIYRSSYNALNNTASNYNLANVAPSFLDANNNLLIDLGTNGFLNAILNQNPTIIATPEDYKIIKSINERKNRLTENNLIVATSLNFSKTTKTNIVDNEFYIFRTKIETAGNFLSLLEKRSNPSVNNSGNSTFFDVEYSQFVKTEFELIKHWDFKNSKVLATRTFVGLAIPYGNSSNIPFSRSYFAGGSNDNRAWTPYGLGPGSSGSLNDFNEANLKIAFSTEYRFKMFGKFRGALFADLGNIWNVLDDIEDPKQTFTGLNSLKDIALGTGFGLRYDFGFVLSRIDLGFKTYDPSYAYGNRWFNDYNFKNSVINIGINYPF